VASLLRRKVGVLEPGYDSVEWLLHVLRQIFDLLSKFIHRVLRQQVKPALRMLLPLVGYSPNAALLLRAF